MSKAYDLNQKSDFPAAFSNFETELKSEVPSVNSKVSSPTLTTQLMSTDTQQLDQDNLIPLSQIFVPDLGAVQAKIERLEGRKRRFCAKVQIPYSLEQVWQVLTDYEAFPEFIPNLTQVRRLEHPKKSIRLEQFLTKKFMSIKFTARMVLDMEEKFPHEIREHLVEGDFKIFSGCWRLEPWSHSDGKAGVELVYELLVWPKSIFPIALVEYVLSQDVPKNILAICQRVEALFGSSCQQPPA